MWPGVRTDFIWLVWRGICWQTLCQGGAGFPVAWGGAGATLEAPGTDQARLDPTEPHNFPWCWKKEIRLFFRLPGAAGGAVPVEREWDLHSWGPGASMEPFFGIFQAEGQWWLWERGPTPKGLVPVLRESQSPFPFGCPGFQWAFSRCWH